MKKFIAEVLNIFLLNLHTNYNLQKCIIWPKESKKGLKKQKKTYTNLGPHSRKFNILLETK